MDYKRILALHYTGGMSGREIAQTTGDGKTTVNEFLKRFRECEELSYRIQPIQRDSFEIVFQKIKNILELILFYRWTRRNEKNRIQILVMM